MSGLGRGSRWSRGSLLPCAPWLGSLWLGSPRLSALWLCALVCACGKQPAETAGVQLAAASPMPHVNAKLLPSFPRGPETCFNAVDDNSNGLLDEGCGTPSGLVHIAISWREPDVDVDLDVIDPEGELVEVDRPKHSGLLKVRDCPGEDNACRGVNTEHVVLEPDHALPVGRYTLRVRLEKSYGAELPIRVQLGGRLGPKSYRDELALITEKAEQQVVWEL
jgi:hypothetical protein